MSSKIESVASSIRDTARYNKFPLLVAAALYMDNRCTNPSGFRDEFSEMFTVDIKDDILVFHLLAKNIKASLFELYNFVLDSLKDAGYTSEIKTSQNFDDTADLTVVAKKEEKIVGKIDVMHGSDPLIGVHTGTYDNFGRPGRSYDSERGVLFKFDENNQEDAIKIMKAYDERVRKFIANTTTQEARN